MRGEQFGELERGAVERIGLPGIEVQPGLLAIVTQLNRRLRPDAAFSRLGAVSPVWVAIGNVVDEHEPLLDDGGQARPLTKFVLEGIDLIGQWLGGGNGIQSLVLAEHRNAGEVHAGHVRCRGRRERSQRDFSGKRKVGGETVGATPDLPK
jgi:hypothetical protein